MSQKSGPCTCSVILATTVSVLSSLATPSTWPASSVQ